MPTALEILLSVLVGTSAPATAAPSAWQVMLWSDPLVVSIDPASITRSDSRITARVRWDYSDEQTTLHDPKRAFRSMIGLVVFDCGAQRFGGAGGTSYSEEGGGGEVVDQFAIKPSEAMLTDSPPGTVAHELVAFVCTQANNGT